MSYLPDHIPVLSPSVLCRVLTEPLQDVLRGRCFTASLTKSTRHIEPPRTLNSVSLCCSRYIATKFKLLGDEFGSFTVKSLLCEQLCREHMNFDIKNGEVPSHIERLIEPSMHCDSSSVLSSLSDTCTRSQHVFLEPSSGLQTSSRILGHGNTGELQDSPPFQESPTLYTLPQHTLCTTTVLSSSLQSQCLSTCINDDEESIGRVDEECISLCDNVLDELMSTWREGCEQKCVNTSLHCTYKSCDPISLSVRVSTNDISYDETFPDSESFLEEFQCGFEENPVVATNTSCTPGLQPPPIGQSVLGYKNVDRNFPPSLKKSHCLGAHPRYICQLTPSDLSECVSQFTPELFSGGSCPATSGRMGFSDGGSTSPELFGTPSSEGASKSSSQVVSVCEATCTPGIGLHLKTVPKRRLITPIHSVITTPTGPVQSSHKSTPVTISCGSGIAPRCHSPELFP